MSSVTVLLQSSKKPSFAAKILLWIILSSNARDVARGCCFWQRSWFSDDCYTKKGHLFWYGTISSPKPLISLLQNEARDEVPLHPARDISCNWEKLMALIPLDRQVKSVKYHQSSQQLIQYGASPGQTHIHHCKDSEWLCAFTLEHNVHTYLRF